MRNTILLLAFCLSSILPRASAQSGSGLDSVVQLSVDTLKNLYYQHIGENAGLYIGAEYVMNELFDAEENKNVYFQSIYLTRGAVYYNGNLYENIPLSYDVYHQDIITRRFSQDFRIRLSPDKISFFILAGHRFVMLKDDSTQSLPMGSGFYDVLYEGNSWVMAKRQKKLLEKNNSLGITRTYEPGDALFVVRDKVWYPVDSKRGLLDAFSDRKKEIRKYLRKENLSISRRNESAIAKVASYYDQLKRGG